VRAAATQKVMCIFDEVRLLFITLSQTVCSSSQQTYEIQAEKRGNFVVISSVEGARVVSWSLNVIIDIYIF
jgi:hypothetical protein